MKGKLNGVNGTSFAFRFETDYITTFPASAAGDVKRQLLNLTPLMLQFNLVVRKWSFFGQPSYIQLAPQPGATVRPPGTTRGSLFLRSENRGLVEIYWGGGAWAWNEHGQVPGRSLSITAPVGPAVTLPGGWASVLVVCSNGEVYERRNSEEVSLCERGSSTARKYSRRVGGPLSGGMLEREEL
jgi:hypothetical protein